MKMQLKAFEIVGIIKSLKKQKFRNWFKRVTDGVNVILSILN